MHIRGRLKGERASENERQGKERRQEREEERRSEGERKRDEENKRAAERAGTLFVALLKIHKALCLLTKDTRLAPVAPQSRAPRRGGSRHLRASSTPRERRALSRKIKLLVALFSMRRSFLS